MVVPVKFLGPERKIVTILFADFAGFTEFVRKHDPELVHEWLKSIWAEVDTIITGHGGSVAKHIGDAVMAVFGDKQAREDAPAQAVRAGLTIQARLAHLRTGSVQPQLRMRVGVHSGMVVLEPLSPTGEFRATGTAINLASHLEQAAPPDRVLISQEVFRSVYGLFDLHPLEPLAIKGISERVQAYVVGPEKARAVARQLRDIEGVSTDMVGRKEELQSLQNAFRRVLEAGCAQVVTVIGEAGIGKTRLLQEFQRWAELLPDHFWFFFGQATADTRSMPFGLMRDVFASRFEIRDSDSPSVAREKLETGVLGLLSRSKIAAPWSGQELRQTAHFMGQLLGLDFSSSPCVSGLLHDPQQLRHHAFQAFRRFFSALGQSSGLGPEVPEVKAVLLVLEDLHWSDQGSLDMLVDLAHGCKDTPLLIICLSRPNLLERQASWGSDLPAHLRLRLDSLSVEESRNLVRTILRKAPAVPPALRDMVTDLAEGNPFYIEEFIKMLIDQKVITPGPERWAIEAQRLASARVPQTLAGVLQARLDGLSLEERTVLQRAAVIGRVFWDRALEALGTAEDSFSPLLARAGRLGPEDVARAIRGLRSKELILLRGASAFEEATEYTFKHELLRSAAYESLLTKLRRELHGKVASWLLRQSGERSAEFAAQVAAHFEQAGQQLEAANWYGRAGHQARAGHEPVMAIEYLRKAADLLPTDRKDFEPRRLDWLCSLMESFCDQARFKDAGRLAVKVRSRAEQTGDLTSQARAWNGLAFLHERRAANRASFSAALRAESLARKAGKCGMHEQLRAMHLRGWALYRLGKWSSVLTLSRRTQWLCKRLGDRHGLAATLKLQGVVHLQRGESKRADQSFEKGLQLCEEFGDRRNAAAMLSNLGESARLRGDFAIATDYYEKALAIARQIGNRESELVYVSNLSGARLGLGQFREAEAALRQIIPLANTRTSSMLSEAFSFLAQACLGQGKIQASLESARRAVELGRRSGNELDTAIGWRVLGQAAAATREKLSTNGNSPGRLAPASPSRCFGRSLLLFRKIKAEAEQARTLRAWAVHEFSIGSRKEALQKLRQARRIFIRLRMRRELDATTSLFTN